MPVLVWFRSGIFLRCTVQIYLVSKLHQRLTSSECHISSSLSTVVSVSVVLDPLAFRSRVCSVSSLTHLTALQRFWSLRVIPHAVPDICLSPMQRATARRLLLQASDVCLVRLQSACTAMLIARLLSCRR